MVTGHIAEIAGRLIELRDIYRYSEDELAEKLQIPADEYQKYEAGKTDIPVGILYEIAHLYQVDLTELLTGDKAHLSTYSLVKAQKRPALEKGNHYTYRNLAYNYAHRRVEPLLVYVEPGDEAAGKEPNTHDGHEFQFCLTGSYRMLLGNKEFTVEEGDSLYFDARQPHAMTALGGRTAELLVIVI